MPQLDRFAFVSQVLWLIAVFLTMYFVILRTGLPTIYKVLKFRKNKLEYLRDSVVRLEKEVFFLNNSTKNLILNFVKSFKDLPSQFEKIIDQGLEDKKVELKKSFEKDRQFQFAVVNEENRVRDLRLCNLIDSTEFVKDKVSLRKKVIGN